MLAGSCAAGAGSACASLRCSSSDSASTLRRKTVPPSAWASAPVEPGVASFRGEQSAVHRDEGSVTPRTEHVYRPRELLLAGAGLAGQQHRRVSVRHHARPREQVRELRVARHELGLPFLARVDEARRAQGTAHLREEVILLERLGQEGECTQTAWRGLRPGSCHAR